MSTFGMAAAPPGAAILAAARAGAIQVKSRASDPGRRFQPALRLAVHCWPHPARRKTGVTRPKPSTPDFEAALAELESIVQRLEQGELSLEDSLRQFERGVVLTRTCQKALQQAEQKIRVLSKAAGGELVEQDFDAPAQD